ncbi:MAG: hypothetical protein ISP49_11530 [Reyranella sp.]|nr:hypothetical protein [Reyranella sp.]
MFIRLCLLTALAIGAAAVPANSDDGRTTKWTAVDDGQLVLAQARGTKTPTGYRGSPPCGFIMPC